jgi:hypothetical protein
MKKGFAPILILIPIAFVLGLVAMFVYFQFKPITGFDNPKLPTVENPQTSPTSSPQSSDETANWETHTDTLGGFSIKYPSDKYTAKISQLGSLLIPTDQFNQNKPLAVTYKILISSGPKPKDLSTDPKSLFGHGGISYDKSILANREIKEVDIANVKAYKVDNLPVGQAGLTSDIVFLNGNNFYEITVEPVQVTGNPTTNKNLVDQILSTFQFLN